MVTIELRLVGFNWTRSKAAKVTALNFFGTHEFVFDVHKDMRIIGLEHRCPEVFPEWRFRAFDDKNFGGRITGDQCVFYLTLDGNWNGSGLEK